MRLTSKKGKWKYLYRAIDREGRTIDFMLSHSRDVHAAKRFFKKALKHCLEVPLKMTTDKNSAYGKAIEELKKEGILSTHLQHRQCKYLN